MIAKYHACCFWCSKVERCVILENRNVVKNYLYNLLYQILIIVLPIITIPYLSRVLGADNVGIYSYTYSIITYFILVSKLGIIQYGKRKIAYLQTEKDERSKCFWELFFLRICTVLLSLGVYAIFFWFNREYSIYYRILSLELIATIFDISWFYQGIEDFKKVVLRNSVVKIITLAFIFLLVKEPGDLWKYILIYVFSNFIGNITLWINLQKYVDRIKIRTIDLKKHIKPCLSLFLPQIAISIYTILDKTMLGAMCENIAEVGFYEQAQKIVKIPLLVITALETVMIPRIASVYVKKDFAKMKNYMKDSFQFVWLLATPLVLGIVVIAPKFVPWFLGNEYLKSSLLMIVLSPIILFISLSTITGSQYFMTIKKENIHTAFVTIGAIINVLLNVVLIPKYYSLGAAIATLLAELIIASAEIIYILKKKMLTLDIIFKGFTKYLFCSAFMFLCIYLFNKYTPSGMTWTFATIMLGMFIYGLTLLIIRDDYVYSLFKLLKKKKQIKKQRKILD